MGFLKYGVGNQAATKELCQHIQLPGRLGRIWRKLIKQLANEYENSLFLEMEFRTFEK